MAPKAGGAARIFGGGRQPDSHLYNALVRI